MILRTREPSKKTAPTMDELLEAIVEAKYSDLIGFATLLSRVSREYADVKLGEMQPKDWVAFLHEGAEAHQAYKKGNTSGTGSYQANAVAIGGAIDGYS